MIYVIRHGQTDWNKNKITMGRCDIPLNGEGIRQAYFSKELINNYDIDFIICSPLTRARQTADIVNIDRNVKILYDKRITERFLGDLEGNAYPNDNNDIWDININSNKYCVEPMVNFKNRIYGFIEYIMNEYPDKNILVVTHGGVSALFNCYFNDTLYNGTMSDKFLKNCSIAQYSNEKEKKYLKLL